MSVCGGDASAALGMTENLKKLSSRAKPRDLLFDPWLEPWVRVTLDAIHHPLLHSYLCVLSEVSSRAGLAFQESRTVQTIARKVCGCLFIGFGVKVAMATR